MHSTRKPRYAPLAIRFRQHVAVVDDASSCWLWEGALDPKGYGRIMSQGRHVLAHRVSYEMAKGAIPKGKHVLHRCDSPACVRPTHLFLGTHADNMRDMAVKGRMGCGYGVKLTPDKVREIRQRHAAGVTQQRLADEYGVALMTINHAIKRRTWKHVD